MTADCHGGDSVDETDVVYFVTPCERVHRWPHQPAGLRALVRTWLTTIPATGDPDSGCGETQKLPIPRQDSRIHQDRLSRLRYNSLSYIRRHIGRLAWANWQHDAEGLLRGLLLYKVTAASCWRWRTLRRRPRAKA